MCDVHCLNILEFSDQRKVHLDRSEMKWGETSWKNKPFEYSGKRMSNSGWRAIVRCRQLLDLEKRRKTYSKISKSNGRTRKVHFYSALIDGLLTAMSSQRINWKESPDLTKRLKLLHNQGKKPADIARDMSLPTTAVRSKIQSMKTGKFFFGQPTFLPFRWIIDSRQPDKVAEARRPWRGLARHVSG